MIKGSCLCQEVQYEYDAPIHEVAICHCNQCKRAQGTAFVTNAPIDANRFTLTQGEAHLKAFFSNPNKKRVFCGNCGSPLYSQRLDMPEVIRLRVGTVTEGQLPEPAYEIYCESKASWYSANADRPAHQRNKE